ncbi:hypothetical protein BCR32DRAFT_330633 [Anaeromyces robustus]|uniref:SH3 domain-containing protein n=1 Tax=Anaeromyces robustus TaxID=1754192 RepID=A0A1Y1VST3_9FUNG|nr:hypothetical protein BCR32DRAFT_330633 [Anaeromyces robustus]|eukprot:ORX64351.1 hypothetical protein BCR32DRAFT_330633 [Anaeromyces robustus]
MNIDRKNNLYSLKTSTTSKEFNYKKIYGNSSNITTEEEHGNPKTNEDFLNTSTSREYGNPKTDEDSLNTSTEKEPDNLEIIENGIDKGKKPYTTSSRISNNYEVNELNNLLLSFNDKDKNLYKTNFETLNNVNDEDDNCSDIFKDIDEIMEEMNNISKINTNNNNNNNRNSYKTNIETSFNSEKNNKEENKSKIFSLIIKDIDEVIEDLNKQQQQQQQKKKVIIMDKSPSKNEKLEDNEFEVESEKEIIIDSNNNNNDNDINNDNNSNNNYHNPNDNNNKGLAVVLYDFNSFNPEELSIKKYEYVVVTDWHVKKGWVYGYKWNNPECVGIFPEAIIKKCEDKLDLNDEKGDLVFALYDFTGNTPNELDIKRNDRIRILDWNFKKGWVYGYKSGNIQHKGIIPEAFVCRVYNDFPPSYNEIVDEQFINQSDNTPSAPRFSTVFGYPEESLQLSQISTLILDNTENSDIFEISKNSKHKHQCSISTSTSMPLESYSPLYAPIVLTSYSLPRKL